MGPATLQPGERMTFAELKAELAAVNQSESTGAKYLAAHNLRRRALAEYKFPNEKERALFVQSLDSLLQTLAQLQTFEQLRKLEGLEGDGE